jgi:hypothetical protein
MTGMNPPPPRHTTDLVSDAVREWREQVDAADKRLAEAKEQHVRDIRNITARAQSVIDIHQGEHRKITLGIKGITDDADPWSAEAQADRAAAAGRGAADGTPR